MIDLDSYKTMNDLCDLKVAKALIYNPENKILVLKRGDSHPCFAGQCDFPGGLIEEGPDIAIRREIFEEIGYSANESPVSMVFSETFDSNNNTHYVYRLNLNSNININLSWEHKDYQWMSEDEIICLDTPEYVDGYFLTVVDFLKMKKAS